MLVAAVPLVASVAVVAVTALQPATAATTAHSSGAPEFMTHYTVSTVGGPMFITGGPGCPQSPQVRYQSSRARCDLWFTEFTGSKVARMTAGGQVTEYPASGSLPASSAGGWITTGPDGNIWFTLGSFPTPTYFGGAVGRITPEGRLALFPLPDPASGPNGIVTGPDGNLWFTEINAKKIGRITPAGRLTEFPLPADIPAMTGPHEITMGPDGNLWFTIPGANQIAKMTTSGALTRYTLPAPPAGTGGAAQTPATRRPAAITAGPDGNLWFTERAIGAIGRITTNGHYTDFPLPYGRGSINADLGEIGVGAGAVWFTEQRSKCVGRITPRGAITEFADTPQLASNPGSNVVAGPGGDMWFDEWNFQSASNVVGRLNPGLGSAPAAQPCPPPA